MRELPLAVDDKHIIERILEGKVRDFALLVQRYQDRAMTLAMRLIGDRPEAEELVQDAFMRAYRSLGQFRGDAQFHTWLYRILYNLCLTRIRRRKGKPDQVDLEDAAEFNVNLAGADERNIQDILEAVEQKEILSAEIENLPEKFKTAVTLFYLQEMTYEEIGGIMEIPMGTVKTYLYRGRALLSRRVLARCSEGVHAA